MKIQIEVDSDDFLDLEGIVKMSAEEFQRFAHMIKPSWIRPGAISRSRKNQEDMLVCCGFPKNINGTYLVDVYNPYTGVLISNFPCSELRNENMTAEDVAGNITEQANKEYEEAHELAHRFLDYKIMEQSTNG